MARGRSVTAGFLFLGQNGSTGNLTFSNGSTGAFTAIGVDDGFSAGSNGLLNIQSGALVTGTSLLIAENAIANTGTVTVDGSGANLTITGAGATTIGAASASTGVFNLQNSGTFNSGTGTTTLNTTGTINIDGGTVNLNGTLVRNGGVLNFNTGALSIIDNFTVGTGGLLGVNLTLDASRAFTTTATTTIDAGRALTLNGGTFSTGALVTNGTLAFNSGTLGINGVGGFNIGTGVLGANVSLGSGSTLQVTNTATVASGASLALNGGSFSAGVLSNTGTVRVNLGTAAAASVANNSGGRIFIDDTLSVSGAFTNAIGARLTLQNGAGLLIGAGALTNSGLVNGDGSVAKPLTNGTSGEVRGESGHTLSFTGAAVNNGQFDLLGGTLEFSDALTNSATGFVSGRGALFASAITNNGVMAFSGGTTDIRGDVTNAAGARIVTSGAGSLTTFFDDVVHNGLEIFTGAGASTVFYGNQSGAGNFTGTGTIYYIGDLRPGNSPAAVTYEGDLVFGNSTTLTLELGGITAGAEYDHVSVGGTLYQDGVLDVVLYSGFTPAAGASFDLIDAGAVAGSFDAVNLPMLGGGLSWDTSQFSASGTVSVVPEPTSAVLLLSGAALLGLRRRRSLKARTPMRFPFGPTLGVLALLLAPAVPRAGADATLISYPGNVVLGNFTTLTMELGGTARGTQYDAMDVAGKLTFAGTLAVPLINSFVPAAGDSFDLFNWGTTAGSFTTVNLPALDTGLLWDTGSLYTSGTASVVPEPTSAVLLLGGAVLLRLRRRRS